MRHGRIGQAGAAVMGHKRTALAFAAAAALLTGCGGTTFNNPFSTTAVPQEDLPTISDRFDQLFGGRGKVSEVAPDGTELDCPPVRIRAGASTYGVAPPGKQPVASELNYQATITRTARDCRRTGNGQIAARIGIQGRVIAGPAGAPSSVEVPLRVAVVLGGVNEKVIATKAYKTTVEMSEDNSVPFSFVADDLVYPVPSSAVVDSYIFYIGFDPAIAAPEPKPKVVRKRK
jgi:hypothetical protein